MRARQIVDPRQVAARECSSCHRLELATLGEWAARGGRCGPCRERLAERRRARAARDRAHRARYGT